MDFLQKKNDKFQFKVTFQDGTFRLMTNEQLKQHYVYELLAFYEKHIDVTF